MDFFGRRTAWMFGKTPPEAMVTPPKSLFNSSSFLTARVMCLGTILDFLLSRAALPASSKISAHKYSRTAARYTPAPLPVLLAYPPFFKYLPTLATGNWRPALAEELTLLPPLPPLPLPPPTCLPPLPERMRMEDENGGWERWRRNEKEVIEC